MGLGSAVSYVIFGIVFLLGLYFVRRMSRTRVD
jgi:ABC-type sugar transport system permease subunit